MYQTKLDKLLQLVERKLILKAIRDNHGHRSAAARQLGISRSRLYRRLTQLDIQIEDSGEPSTTEQEEVMTSAVL
ncbi:MAG: helix-turn-helix domain-containing protein [Phycisphaerales bacterium]|nr:MAG: helix-turn-helix domain-containing protein [Phycisphaerales bacterium]